VKLIIQIPCFNEEEVLPKTLSELPREVEGFDSVEWTVIDDGSTDNTLKVAEYYKVDHIVKHTHNQGLAKAFLSGVEHAIECGADVIVNTDADNQYPAKYIKDLTKLVLFENADIAIGVRDVNSITQFSRTKKLLQKLGSRVVNLVSSTNVEDAPSGFRAFSRHAAKKIFVFDTYTYTLETIIQARQKNLIIKTIPINVNDEERESRLVKSIFSYVYLSIKTIFKIFVIYKPFTFFSFIANIFLFFGLLISARFLYYYFSGSGDGYIQSLLLASIFLIIGFQTYLVAFLSDLIASNRKLLEEIRFKLFE